jgi:hypothetical protein
MRAVPGGDNAQRVGIVGQFENILKIVTGAIGLVAAIGFPAVALHLIGYGVPVRTASYDFILRAGALPAIVLVLLVAYAYAARRMIARTGVGGVLAAHMLPFFVPAFLVMFGGLLAYLVLLVWAMLWGIRWLIGDWVGASLSNRTLLLAAAVMVAGAYGLYGVVVATRRYWIHRQGFVWRFLGALVEKSDGVEGSRQTSGTPAGVPAEQTPAPSSTGTVSKPTTSADSSFDWALGLVFVPVSLLVLYSIKGVLYVWDPGWSTFLPHRYIFYGSMFFGLLFTLLMVIVTRSQKADDSSSGPRGNRGLIVTVALAYVVFEVSYCAWAYPRLYSGVGGGRPTPVTVWLKADDGGADVLAVLSKANTTTVTGATRLGAVFMLFDNADGILLTDTQVSPGKAVFIPHNRVTALSW